jgi:hypothetical protein
VKQPQEPQARILSVQPYGPLGFIPAFSAFLGKPMTVTQQIITGEWSNPVRMSSAIKDQWWTQCTRSPGVYRLIALRNTTSFEPLTLARVCGRDQEGTVQIGGARNLHNRLSQLVMASRGDYRGKPHRVLCAPLAKLLPAERLAFSWQTHDEPWVREKELLLAYEAAFGELPPNNNQRPR